jgi:hypothetical protein
LARLLQFREVAQQVAAQVAVQPEALQASRQRVHLNGVRQTHPFFVSKKVPCAVDYNHRSAA